MRFLLFKRSKYHSAAYELEEFATEEELAAKLFETFVAFGDDIIVAERRGIELRFCDWPAKSSKEDPS
jgi:hypothetical protein